LVDLGVSLTPINNAKEVHKIKTTKSVKMAGDQESLLKAEEEFVKSYQNSKEAAYRYSLSDKSILTRNKSLPATTSKDRFDIIASTPEGIEFNLIGSGIASSGDLGYVYGTAALNGKLDNFLRIWRKEKNGWKIALEVLRY
jgi:ketosteroid isomerase-like protein